MKIGIIYNVPKECFRGPRLDLMSDAEMAVVPQLVATELSKCGFEPVMIYADWHLIPNCRAANVALALNLAEGFEQYNGHEHLVPCLLEYGQIPYTGADPTNMLLVRDKLLTKRIVQSLGGKTPKFHFVSDCKPFNLTDLTFPLILKPVREEASIGIGYDSVVVDSYSLHAQLEQLIQNYQQPILIEEYISGREISIGVWGNKSISALPPCEFVFPEEDPLRKFRSFEYKWLSGQERMRCPNDINPAVLQHMQEFTIAVHQALSCRDYSRCDFRIGPGNTIYCLEHNFNPGIGPNTHGLSNTFTRMAEYAGYSFGDMLSHIISIAKERCGLL